MIPTVQQVKDLVREMMGDVEVAAGQVFQDSGAVGVINLQTHFGRAYRDVFRVLDLYQIPVIERFGHFNLPINTSVLYPATMGISNFGEPMAVHSREVRSTFTVAAVTPGAGTCLVRTSAPHDFSTGDRVVLWGVGGISADINDEWVITVVDADEFTLNGCVATGAFTGGGTVSSGVGGSWSPGWVQANASEALGLTGRGDSYAWTGDRFIFIPRPQIVQLKIKYSLSGNPPTSDADSVGIDDSLDLLAHLTASYAAIPFGADDMAAYHSTIAIGKNHDLDNPDGLLGNMINRGLQTVNLQSNRTQRFMPRRGFRRF